MGAKLRLMRTCVVSEHLDRLCGVISREYADLAHRGLWFTPAREALDAFVNSVNQRITGQVRLKLFKGHCEILDASETTPAPTLIAIS